MTKKLTAVIVLTCMLFTMFAPCTYAADAPFYKLIAEEMLTTADYTASGWEQPNVATAYAKDASGNYVLTGKGWAANWVVKDADDTAFREPEANDKVKFYFAAASSNRVLKLDSMPLGTFLYRQFAKPFEFGGASGIYSFSIEIQDGSSGAGGSAFRQKIGEAFTVGYDYVQGDATKIVPIIEVGGTKVSAESPLTMSHNGGDSGKFMVFETTVSLNKSGDDTIIVKIYEKGAQPNSTVSTTADLTSLIEYVGIGSTGTTLLRIRNLKAEYSNQAAYDRIVNIANNGTTDAAELQAAIADLAEYNGADKDTLLAQLRAHATGALEGVDELKLVSISPDISAPLLVSDTEKLELLYNFMLDETAVFNLYNTVTETQVTDVTSNTDGNAVTLTLSQPLESGVSYEIKATGTDFKGDAVPPVSFRTSAIPEINISDGGNYPERTAVTWTEGVEVTAVLENEQGSEETIQNGHIICQPGEYVITLTASKNNFSDTVVMNITIDADFVPVASNVRIEGEAETDSVLEAKFDYSDANGDEQGEHIIVWYKLADEGNVKIGEGATYTLTEADENSDIILSVTPVSTSNVNPVGEEVLSDVFKGAYKPEASDVKIMGELAADAVLEVTYEYSDVNGDEKGTPVVKWYIKDEESDTEIVNNITDGKLKITDEVFEKYVYAVLTPVSAKKPYNGDSVKTEAALMPSRPVVSNVRIEGSASVGSVLTAYYSFEDPNLDAERISKFEWKDSAGNVIGRERKLTVTSGMAGKTITVTVIGVSEKIPTDSIPVTSAPFTVSGGSSSGGVSGGVSGGGGFGYSVGPSGTSGGGSSSGGSAGTTTPVVPVTPAVPEKETVFGDVYGHWAQEYVTVLLEKGVVIKDESFRPDDSISRAEVLAMLFRSAGIELSTYNDTYGDVQSSDWFADYIQTALDMGIISPDDNFRPNDGITREEAAKIIAIMLKLKSENVADFADFDTISDWATEFVNAVYEAGIFKGDENGNFNAKGTLTRAETATVIYRLLNENVIEDGGAE